jgi:hypothetical protein
MASIPRQRNKTSVHATVNDKATPWRSKPLMPQTGRLRPDWAAGMGEVRRETATGDNVALRKLIYILFILIVRIRFNFSIHGHGAARYLVAMRAPTRLA